MRRQVIRGVMVAIGLVSFLVYAAGAFLTYWVVQRLWVDRPSAVATVAVLVAVTLAIGYLSYRFGTERLLDAIDAKQVTEQRDSVFFRTLDRLCAEMAIERPRVYLTNMGEPNAFAVSGPQGGAVVFDRALVELLTAAELEAVLAHELAHLESHDSLVQLVAFTGLQTVTQVMTLLLLPGLLLLTGVAKATAWMRGQPGTWTRSLAWKVRTLVLAFVMFVPVVITFILFVRSRRREYAADERAATVTGDPLALARALEKIEAAAKSELALRTFLPTEESEADPVARLLATHPATENRIARLERLAENET